MQRRHLLQLFSGLSLLAGLAIAPAQAQDKPIRIGVTGGPHAEIMEVVKKIAAKDGLKIQVVEFSDYIQPNAALAAGDLDANSFQHLPYMEAQVKDRGYKFANAGYTITEPMGVYSKSVKSLGNLKTGARVGVPNDPTNGGRALLLLQSKGLFKLKADAGLQATPLDIVSNPKKNQDRRTRCSAIAALTGGFRCRRHQRQLCRTGRAEPNHRLDRDRRPDRPVRQHDRRARTRQEQTLGGKVDQGLPQPGSQTIRAAKIQEVGHRSLVSPFHRQSRPAAR